MPERLLIFGASGHGFVVAEAARLAGWELLGFADDDPNRESSLPEGLPMLAIGLEQARDIIRRNAARFVVGIGDNSTRRSIYEQLSCGSGRPATIVHPAAVVSPAARVGPGTVVFAGVVVNPRATVGANVILNTSCSIDHDNQIGDHVHVSPGAHLGGTVCVGEGTHVGLGASVRNNTRIGAWSVIGMGSVVVHDLPDRIVAFGCPARPQRGTR